MKESEKEFFQTFWRYCSGTLGVIYRIFFEKSFHKMFGGLFESIPEKFVDEFLKKSFTCMLLIDDHVSWKYTYLEKSVAKTLQRKKNPWDISEAIVVEIPWTFLNKFLKISVEELFEPSLEKMPNKVEGYLKEFLKESLYEPQQ